MVMYLPLVTSIFSPPAVSRVVVPLGTSLALRAAPGTTWRRSTAVRASLSARRPLRVSDGILAKASLVGAKTVKGPSLVRVSTRPAALTAARRVESWGVAMASSAMFLVGAGAVLVRLWWPPPGEQATRLRQVRLMKVFMLRLRWLF